MANYRKFKKAKISPQMMKIPGIKDLLVDRKCRVYQKGHPRAGKGYVKVLLWQKGNRGCHVVLVWREGKRKVYTCHRLMLMALGKLSENERVWHRVPPPTDNRLRNLKVTEDRKLTVKEVRKIKKLLKKGKGPKEIGEMFGIRKQRIHKIKTKENWAEIK
jgi:hypothetical protein